MFHRMRTLALCSPLTLLLGLSAGCDVSNGQGPGQSQDPDPVVVDIPIAFIARTLPRDEEGNVVAQNILAPHAFHPGASLIFKERAKASAREFNLTAGLFPDVPEDPDDDNSDFVPAEIDIKDLVVSPDGERLLFSLRAPTPLDDEAPIPTWNIWEYDTISGQLYRIISDEKGAEEGDDVAPQYLPDGRIVFSSNRQTRTRAVLLDEGPGKPQYSGITEIDDQPADDNNGEQTKAFNLHVVDPAEGDITQLTFNPSHDLQPTILDNGRIAFLRWDTRGQNRLSFYTVRPDGTDIQRYYGYHSQNSGPADTPATFWKAASLGDGRLLTNQRALISRHWGGDIVTIDGEGFTDINQENPQNPGAGSAQQSIAPIAIDITEDNNEIFSPGGFYNSAFHLNDGTDRLLISWSPCLVESLEDNKQYPCTRSFLSQPNIRPAAPAYGIWVLNNSGGTQLPIKIAESGSNIVYTDVVAFTQPVPAPIIAPSTSTDLAAQGLAQVHIRNIYDIDGSIAEPVAPMPHLAPRSERPERFLRLVRAVPIPHPNEFEDDFDRNIAFGVNNRRYMREIIGYVPIEPDGSAKFVTAADVAFSFSLVDATGKRVTGGFHSNWLSLKPGENFECVGCHDANSTLPHGRKDAEPESSYLGAPFIGMELVDANDQPVIGPITGQSMGEHFARRLGARVPSTDLLYRDIWTQNSANREDDIAIAYNQLPTTDETLLPADSAATCTTAADEVLWPLPVAPAACLSNGNPSPYGESPWLSNCRITLNYETHIQPLWERDRRSCDDTGAEIPTEDRTCISCHSINNTDELGMAAVPAASLFLTRDMPQVDPRPTADATIRYADNCTQAPRAGVFASYRQLLNRRLQLEYEDGMLRGVLDGEPTTEDQVQDDGDPNTVDPVIVVTTYRCVQEPGRAMTTTGAASSRFFDLFEGNDAIHSGILSPTELRIIAEWLDLGGQYYNNPFDAPVDD